MEEIKFVGTQEFHVTHATIFSLLITLYHNGAIQ